MRTLLMLAYEFAPYHRPGSTIGAQRPFQFAKHLPSFGWRSIVLCSDFKTRYTLAEKSDWKKQVDELVASSLASHSEKETIVIPLPSLTHVGFADKLWHQSVVMDKVRGTFSPRGGLLNRIIRPLATFFKLFIGDHSQSWQPVALYASELLLKKVNADMILAEHSPDASVFVASRIYKQTKVPWVIDFRDPILRDMKKMSRFIYKSFTIPKFRSLHGSINVNDYWTSLDKKLFSAPAITIPNGFDAAELPTIKSERHIRHELIIGYFGNVQEGQNPEMFIKLIANLEVKFPVKIVIRGNLHELIIKNLDKLNNKNIVLDSSQSIPRPEALNLMATCDILILFSLKIEGDIYLSKGLLPGKTFEYIGLGKPIIVIPGDNGIMDKFILENRLGRICATSTDLTTNLEDAYEALVNGKPIWNFIFRNDFILKFSREKQTDQLAKFLNQVIVV
jgi:glycosyltransferase involved in cell wall biosynthesis